MLWKVFLGVAASGISSVSLQGCGADGGGQTGTSTEKASTASATTSSTPPVSTTLNPVSGGTKVPGGKEAMPWQPTKGVWYKVDVEVDESQDNAPPDLDPMQGGLKPQFETVRDDLGKIYTMGANTVRVLGIGRETKSSHRDFLDRAYGLGLNVIVDFLTVTECEVDYDCSKTWKDVTKNALEKQEFMKDGKWHPAVKAVILMTNPTGNVFGPPSGEKSERDVMRTVVTAFDGFLQGEKAAGLQDSSTVLIGVSWTYAPGSGIPGVSTDDYLYGFRKVKEEVQQAESDLKAAYAERWLNVIEGASPYTTAVKTQVVDKYKDDFGNNKLLYTLYTTSAADVELKNELTEMNNRAAAEDSFFLGVVVGYFQMKQDEDAVSQTLTLFKNGEELLKPAPDTTISSTDPVTGNEQPEGGYKSWKIPCLVMQPLATNLAESWSGTVDGPGLCTSSVEGELQRATDLATAEFV